MIAIISMMWTEYGCNLSHIWPICVVPYDMGLHMHAIMITMKLPMVIMIACIYGYNHNFKGD